MSLSSITPVPHAKVVTEDGCVYIQCTMPVQFVFEKTIPIYYIFDDDGCVMEKIDVENMPKKWRELLEGDSVEE